MTDQDQQQANEYLISRRVALATLATLSSSLLAKVRLGPLTALIIEEFLAQCATSLTVCYHLLQGDGLVAVEATLPEYLPLLISLAKQSSPYQRRAAYLASQGCWLMGLMALHRLRFAERVAYNKQAVECAQMAEDRTLHVMVLASFGNAWYNMGQQAEIAQRSQKALSSYTQMLQAYQEAAYILSQPLNDVPSMLYSKVFAGLAHAYAQQGKAEEASHWILQARTVFSEDKEDLPPFLSTDYGIYQVILFEGLTSLDLDKHDPNGHHGEQAWSKLAQIEQVSPISIPERFKIEITNQRALAAVRTGDMAQFRRFLIEGVQGAQMLKSRKRKDEAVTNWREARKKWPQEKKILELADLLMETF